MKKWEKFTKEDLEQFVKKSKGIIEVGQLVGYSMNGGSGFKTVKEMIDYYQFDTTHFNVRARELIHKYNIEHLIK